MSVTIVGTYECIGCGMFKALRPKPECGWATCPKCGSAAQASACFRPKRYGRGPAVHGDVGEPYYSTNHGRWIKSRRDIRAAQKERGTEDLSDRDIRNIREQVWQEKTDADREWNEIERMQAAGELPRTIINDDPNIPAGTDNRVLVAGKEISSHGG